jgi:hypothetical protein
MKKFFATVLTFLLMLSLFCGCGGSGNFADRVPSTERSGVSSKVENAQYLPDVDKIVGNGNNTAVPVSLVKCDIAKLTALQGVSETENEYDEFEAFIFRNFVNRLAIIESDAGGGKYLGYDVDEIKGEMYMIVNRAPYYNEWFRVSRQGRDEVDYFSDWAFYINNSENDRLTITRVSWKTGGAWGALTINGKYVRESYLLNSMEVRYFFNEEGKEVVEVFMYDTLVDANTLDSYPISYIYLRNIKDSSVLKYTIVVAPRGDDKPYYFEGIPSYGYSQKISYLEYDGTNYKRFGISNSMDHPSIPDLKGGFGFAYQEKTGGEIVQYADTYSLYADDRLYIDGRPDRPDVGEITEREFEGLTVTLQNIDTALNLDTDIALDQNGLDASMRSYLLDISEELIDGFDLAARWPQILSDSDDCKYEVLGPEVALPYKLKYFRNEYVTLYEEDGQTYLDHKLHLVENFKINLSVEAYLTPNSALRGIKELHLFVTNAVMRADGALAALNTIKSANDFDPDYDIMWYGVWYDMGQMFSFSDFFAIKETGKYLVGVCLSDGETTYGNFLPCKFQFKGETITIENGGLTYSLYSYQDNMFLDVSSK